MALLERLASVETGYSERDDILYKLWCKLE